MDKEELIELLDITSGAEFEYFENFADFAEYDGMVDGDAVYELITDVDMKTFAELAESYFYDILENVPGDQIDLYNLLENIKRVLVGLSEAVRKGEDNAELRLSDEFNRFRQWYSSDSEVECRNLSTEETSFIPVRDALAGARLSKLNGEELEFDFENALTYELEEYIMSYADLTGDEE